MQEKLNVRLGNPVVMFFWSSAMFLTGIIVGVYWHPTRTHSIAIAFAAGEDAQLDGTIATAG